MYCISQLHICVHVFSSVHVLHNVCTTGQHFLSRDQLFLKTFCPTSNIYYFDKKVEYTMMLFMQYKAMMSFMQSHDHRHAL